MFFKNFYSWLRYTTTTPFTSFKNRLFIEALSSNSNVYSFLGETNKSFYWSAISTSNLTNLWVRSSKTRFVLTVGSSLTVALLVIFYFNEASYINFYTSLQAISYILWRIFDTLYFSFIQIQYISITYFFYMLIGLINFTTKSNFKLTTFLNKHFSEHSFTFGSLNTLNLDPKVNHETLFNYVNAEAILTLDNVELSQVVFKTTPHNPSFGLTYVKEFYRLVKSLHLCDMDTTSLLNKSYLKYSSDSFLISYLSTKSPSSKTLGLSRFTFTPTNIIANVSKSRNIPYSLDTPTLGVSSQYLPSTFNLDPKEYHPLIEKTPINPLNNFLNFSFNSPLTLRLVNSTRSLRWTMLSSNNSKFNNVFLKRLGSLLNENTHSNPINLQPALNYNLPLPLSSTVISPRNVMKPLSLLNFKSLYSGLLQTSDFKKKLRPVYLPRKTTVKPSINALLSTYVVLTPTLTPINLNSIPNVPSPASPDSLRNTTTPLKLLLCSNSLNWTLLYSSCSVHQPTLVLSKTTKPFLY